VYRRNSSEQWPSTSIQLALIAWPQSCFWKIEYEKQQKGLPYDVLKTFAGQNNAVENRLISKNYYCLYIFSIISNNFTDLSWFRFHLCQWITTKEVLVISLISF